MQLNEWIENKINELIENKVYKSVNFSDVTPVEIEKNLTSETFELFTKEKKISMNTEVEDFIRSALTTKIKGLKITLEVVKPRCRKPTNLYLYVKIK
jgi:hypothetical protein